MDRESSHSKSEISHAEVCVVIEVSTFLIIIIVHRKSITGNQLTAHFFFFFLFFSFFFFFSVPSSNIELEINHRSTAHFFFFLFFFFFFFSFLIEHQIEITAWNQTGDEVPSLVVIG